MFARASLRREPQLVPARTLRMLLGAHRWLFKAVSCQTVWPRGQVRVPRVNWEVAVAIGMSNFKTSIDSLCRGLQQPVGHPHKSLQQGRAAQGGANKLMYLRSAARRAAEGLQMVVPRFLCRVSQCRAAVLDWFVGLLCRLFALDVMLYWICCTTTRLC